MEKKRFLDGDNKHFCVVSRLLCFFCLFIGIYACQVDEDGVVNKGTLVFRMNVDTVLVGVPTKASDLADFKDVNGYAVTIAQDTGVVAKYSRFDKMPAELELGAGAYTVQVSKGTEAAAAFDAPYFSGKKEFTIVKDMTTPVEVTAAMANSRVTIDYSDDFLQTYKDYTLSLKTNKMELPLVYEKGESRPMYFLSDASGTKLEIAMELVNVYGKTVNYTATTTIKPKQWAKLTVRTDEKGLNGIAIDVTLNDETKETVYVNIGIPDFMEKLKGAPYISTEGTVVKWSDSNKDEDFEKTFSSYITVSKVPVSVTAGGKIDKLILSVSENGTTILSYDLANMESAQREELQEKHQLELSDDIKGKISVSFDLQGFLKSLFDKEDRNYTIELLAIDALPQPNKTMKRIIATYKAMASPKIPNVNISAFEEGTYTGSKRITISSVYLKLKSFTFGPKDGEQVDLILNNIENISFERSTALVPTSYTLTLEKDWFNALSVGEHIFVMKAIDAFDREVTNTFIINVTQPPFEWAMAENEGDVFAKYAYLRVVAKDPDKVTFYENGNPLTGLISLGQENGVASFVWKGLTPNQKYSITAKYDGKRELDSYSFTTEEASQVPNAGFEYWYYEKPQSNWKRWFPWDSKDVNTQGWNTLNKKTTSDENVLAPNFAYVNNSGTIETNDKKNGEKAALIRTIGWGEGTKAPGSIGIKKWDGEIKKADSGYLYLGAESDNPETEYYPHSFYSRPTALNFYRKYFPASGKNVSNDNYEVLIKVEYRKDNQTILLGEGLLKEGGKTTSYELKTIPITYTNNSYKATNIYILFKSGIEKGYDYMIVPSYNNLSTGEYIGSQLYVDDVELIYDYQE